MTDTARRPRSKRAMLVRKARTNSMGPPPTAPQPVFGGKYELYWRRIGKVDALSPSAANRLKAAGHDPSAIVSTLCLRRIGLGNAKPPIETERPEDDAMLGLRVMDDTEPPRHDEDIMDDHGQAVAEPVQENPGLRRRLGRGLNALLGGGSGDGQGEEVVAGESAVDSDVRVDAIDRNPFQPRKEFAEGDLEDLAGSIRQHGVLQSLLVRPHNGRFQLIAGERRLLAARRAGLEKVPCRILELVDHEVAEAALEENLKRKDLNPLEKAIAFEHYLDRFEITIEELAKNLSMKRATISNYLRLIELPEPVKNALAAEKISNGHARALLPLSDGAQQIALCERIRKEDWSVRKTESEVRAILKPEPPAAPEPVAEAAPQPVGEHAPQPQQDAAAEQVASHDEPVASHDHEHGHDESAQHHAGHDHGGQHEGGHHEGGEPHHDGHAPAEPESHEHAEPAAPAEEPNNHILSLQDALRDHFGTTVEIKQTGRETGRFVIHFNSNDEFERLHGMLRAA